MWNACNAWICMQVGGQACQLWQQAQGVAAWDMHDGTVLVACFCNDCCLPVGCCPQAPEPHSDSRAAPSNVSWDLSNAALWEAALDEYQSR